MPAHATIRKIFAAFLLLLFALSNTPKTLLHSLAANHKDSAGSQLRAKFRIEAAGFHCDIDHLVVEAPYFSSVDEVVIAPATCYHSFIPRRNVFYHHSSSLHSTSRGPPSLTA